MNPLKQIEPVILGDRLRLARLGAGKTQEDAARALKVARTTIIAIEQGQRRVRPEELNALAQLYATSVNELLRQTAVHVDLSAKFRRSFAEIDRAPATAQAVGLLTKLACSLVELEQRLSQPLQYHYPPQKPILPGNLEEQAEDLALELRHRLGLGLAPIADILSLAELELGIRIFIRPLDSNISGLFAFDPAVGSCILVNSKHPLERQVQTIAHEIGHFLTTRSEPDIFDEGQSQQSREERFVTLFGLAFLMPAAAVRRRFQDYCAASGRFSARHLIFLAHAFNVAVEAMCRRLEALRLLPAGTFDSLRERGFAVQSAKQAVGITQAPQRADTPPRLLLLATQAYDQGILSEEQLCDMLAMDRVQLREQLDKLGSSDLDDAITLQA